MERVVEPKSREEPLCFTATSTRQRPPLDTVSEDVVEMFEIQVPESQDEAAISAEGVLSEVLAEEA